MFESSLRDMGCTTLIYSFFSSSSLKFFVMKSLQVGVRINPPDWFQLYLNFLNPCDSLKHFISFPSWENRLTHTQCSRIQCSSIDFNVILHSSVAVTSLLYFPGIIHLKSNNLEQLVNSIMYSMRSMQHIV